MLTTYVYPARLWQDEDGRMVVDFPDIPWAHTDGRDEAEALRMATDCLSVALRHMLERGEDIPRPRTPRSGEYQVAPDPTVVMKLALIEVAAKSRAPAARLARALGIDHKEARRILDPREPTKSARLAEALAVFGLQAATTCYGALERQRMPVRPSQGRRRAA